MARAKSKLPATAGHAVYIRLAPKDEMSIIDVCRKLEVPQLDRMSFSQCVKIAVEHLLIASRRAGVIPEPDTYNYSREIELVYFGDTVENKGIIADRLRHTGDYLRDSAKYRAEDKERNVPAEMSTLSKDATLKQAENQGRFEYLHEKMLTGAGFSEAEQDEYLNLSDVGEREGWINKILERINTKITSVNKKSPTEEEQQQALVQLQLKDLKDEWQQLGMYKKIDDPNFNQTRFNELSELANQYKWQPLNI